MLRNTSWPNSLNTLVQDTPRGSRFSWSRNPSYRKCSRSPSISPPRSTKRSKPSRKRSPSPHDPAPHHTPTKARTGRKPFRRNASPRPLSACPMCLGCHRHDVANCEATLRWDQKVENRCTRDRGGHLKSPEGIVLCSNWQKPQGCEDSTHSKRHQCSGCGAKDHGAQSCPRAEAASS